ncbi:tRNA (N(6)-L-threonylcarbamoyladenosine(37)-C(2))-methylthiotransferase [Candidatus Pacearchaeota archaeon]|nr:tRNA (N(6)-L-threonylcarbamoyladenosine(37)-C(2))-methylthiotransferase [Candidatus Pacearchaeota archaeon]
MAGNSQNKHFISEVYFETYGCTANLNSSEIMKGLVKQAGLEITNNIEIADLIIINSCIVKGSTQEKIRRRVSDLLKKGKRVVLTGCMPRLNKKKFLKKENLFLLDTKRATDIIRLIQDIVNGNCNSSCDKYLKPNDEIKAALPKISSEKQIGITQISEGCLGDCTYCVVRLAKGKLFSYPKEKILKSIKRDVEAGCNEIWITSQDNAAYGNDISNKDGKKKYLLPELLENILKIKGRFFVRLGMMNPNNVLKILPELIELYKNPKMFKFLHIPIQSGSNKILKEMNRKYKIKDVLKIIKEFKREIPEIVISTDIIVGYPGETQEDFLKTLNVVSKIKPEILNRSNFSSRSGTPAADLKPIKPRIMKKRSNQLMKLHLQICKELQKPWIGKEIKVLVDKKGFENTWLARTSSYKLVAVHSKENLLGKRINVKVKGSSPHYLLAETIK